MKQPPCSITRLDKVKTFLLILIVSILAQVAYSQDSSAYKSFTTLSLPFGIAEGLDGQSSFGGTWSGGLRLAKWEQNWVFQSQVLYHRNRSSQRNSSESIRLNTLNLDFLLGRMISKDPGAFKVAISGGLSLQYGNEQRFVPDLGNFPPSFRLVKDRKFGLGGLILIDFIWSRRPLGNGVYLFANFNTLSNFYGVGLNIVLFSDG